LPTDTIDKCHKLDYSLIALQSNTSKNILQFKNPERASGNIGQITAGLKVKKTGRTSGMTTGTVNGEKATVQTNSQTGCKSEWIVQGIHGTEKGDSGAAVWNESGDFVGILWGSNPNKHTNFVTPIECILSHIYSVTGKDMKVKPCTEDVKSILYLETDRQEVTITYDVGEGSVGSYSAFEEEEVEGGSIGVGEI
jgi:hypothetical protein